MKSKSKSSWLSAAEVARIVAFAKRLGYNLSRTEGCYAMSLAQDLQADLSEADVIEFINRALTDTAYPYPGETMRGYLSKY